MIILPFGQYKGRQINSPVIPDQYILWLAKPRYSGKFYKSLHSMEKSWKVPFSVMAEARLEADRRGWRLIGETWEGEKPAS